MIKHRNILGVIAVSTIIFTAGAMAFTNNIKGQTYKVSIDSISFILERDRLVFQEIDYKGEELAEVDVDDRDNISSTQEKNIDLTSNERNSSELANEEDKLVDDNLIHISKEELPKEKLEPGEVNPINEKVDSARDLSQHLNHYVLDIVRSYDYKGGSYPYLLKNDFENYNGVTEDIYYQGSLLLKAHPSGVKYSHCTGITFEVFFKAMQNRNKAYGIDINDFNGMTKDELFDFILTWYVAMGPKIESNLVVAMEKYGIGHRITNLEEVAPGDFIDLSRENNTGHAVVFIDWIREGDKIIGLKHWSSQGSTKGISYKEEYFNIRGSNGQKYGNVIIDNLHIGRISPINEYK